MYNSGGVVGEIYTLELHRGLVADKCDSLLRETPGVDENRLEDFLQATLLVTQERL